MCVSSGLEWRTEPIRISFGSAAAAAAVVDDDDEFLRFWMKRAKARRMRAWFFSGRNCAMYKMLGSRFASVKSFTSMADLISETAVGGNTTVASLYASFLLRRAGPQRELICADVQDEFVMTTSTLLPTHPYKLAKRRQYRFLAMPFHPVPAPELSPLIPVLSSREVSISVEIVG